LKDQLLDVSAEEVKAHPDLGVVAAELVLALMLTEVPESHAVARHAHLLIIAELRGDLVQQLLVVIGEGFYRLRSALQIQIEVKRAIRLAAPARDKLELFGVLVQFIRRTGNAHILYQLKLSIY